MSPDDPVFDEQGEYDDMVRQLEAAKLREAEQASALEIARTALPHFQRCTCGAQCRHEDDCEVRLVSALLDKLGASSAAIAERDRAIERRVLGSVINEASAMIRACQMTAKSGALELFRNALVKRREFNLDPKPDGPSSTTGEKAS